MGNDVPLACLSKFAPIPYDYFKQLFAQVTNPPIDPFREKVVMSLQCPIGPEANILQPSAKQVTLYSKKKLFLTRITTINLQVHRLWLKQPVISISDLEVLKQTKHRNWACRVIDTTFSASEGAAGVAPALQKICDEADEASKEHEIIVLSDRKAGEGRVPISSLLTLGKI